MVSSQDSDNALLLDNQLCFALYAASRENIRRNRPVLEPLGLTYTQYVVLLALWEQDDVTVHRLGERLHLDSGTLTPLLKKMEAQGWLTRRRDPDDERAVRVTLTPDGHALREKAAGIPSSMACSLAMDRGELASLHEGLANLLQVLRDGSPERSSGL